MTASTTLRELDRRCREASEQLRRAEEREDWASVPDLAAALDDLLWRWTICCRPGLRPRPGWTTNGDPAAAPPGRRVATVGLLPPPRTRIHGSGLSAGVPELRHTPEVTVTLTEALAPLRARLAELDTQRALQDRQMYGETLYAGLTRRQSYIRRGLEAASGVELVDEIERRLGDS